VPARFTSSWNVVLSHKAPRQAPKAIGVAAPYVNVDVEAPQAEDGETENGWAGGYLSC